MSKDLDELRSEVAILREQLAYLRGRVDALSKGSEVGVNFNCKAVFPRLSPKQHAVLQMVLRGAPNEEIAERFGVTLSTAKGAIHGIAKRMGLDRDARGQPVLRVRRVDVDAFVRPYIEALSEEEYQRITGIPKNWDVIWQPKDREMRPKLYERRLDDGPVPEGERGKAVGVRNA